MSRIAVRFLVEGRVQGVWFRGSTQQQAMRLGITGHAINLADGRVEVVAVGESSAVEQLGAWLQKGPPLARVDRVVREPDPVVNPAPDSAFITG